MFLPRRPIRGRAGTSILSHVGFMWHIIITSLYIHSGTFVLLRNALPRLVLHTCPRLGSIVCWLLRNALPRLVLHTCPHLENIVFTCVHKFVPGMSKLPKIGTQTFAPKGPVGKKCLLLWRKVQNGDFLSTSTCMLPLHAILPKMESRKKHSCKFSPYRLHDNE